MVRTLIPMRIAALALVLSGCALYGDDDDVVPDVDAGLAVDAAPSIEGIYRVTLSCIGTCEANPFDGINRAWILDGTPLEVAWSQEVAPTASFTHRGTMASDGCANVWAGDDGDATHSGYRLCPSGRSLSADITWTTSTAFSTWHVALDPL